LIANGVLPSQILALTFTNKAAREMRERLAHLLDHENSYSFMPWMGTFHSICVKILRIEAENVGLSKNYVIYDTDDRLALIKRAMKALDINDKRVKPKAAEAAISKAKNEGKTPDEMMADAYYPNQRDIAAIYERYEEMRKEADAVDFDDLLLYVAQLFLTRKDIREKWSQRFKHILIDEYQDTNHIQYQIVKLLVNDERNICCVGDDWQSIYRFTGSDMALFKQFEDYFGYTKKCLMETTYRFGEPAIAESSKFILANPEQEKKTVLPFRQDAETKLEFISTSRDCLVDTVKGLVDQIPEEKEVLLVGRYKRDIRVFKDTELTVCENKESMYVTYGKRKMPFLTIHKSKGLECDYIILLNCNGGLSGFPSQVNNSPVIEYLLSEPDGYAFSEERRIFYVGITRAKKQTWVLYDKENPSPFVKEFVKTLESPLPGADFPESELCPKCHCGHLRTIKRSIAVNGNPYSVVSCSNEKYGCNYRETRFVNLNSTRRVPRKNNYSQK
jgi:superfamily I DNA/RNA helicase